MGPDLWATTQPTPAGGAPEADQPPAGAAMPSVSSTAQAASSAPSDTPSAGIREAEATSGLKVPLPPSKNVMADETAPKKSLVSMRRSQFEKPNGESMEKPMGESKEKPMGEPKDKLVGESQTGADEE